LTKNATLTIREQRVWSKGIDYKWNIKVNFSDLIMSVSPDKWNRFMVNQVDKYRAVSSKQLWFMFHNINTYKDIDRFRKLRVFE